MPASFGISAVGQQQVRAFSLETTSKVPGEIYTYMHQTQLPDCMETCYQEVGRCQGLIYSENRKECHRIG